MIGEVILLSLASIMGAAVFTVVIVGALAIYVAIKEVIEES